MATWSDSTFTNINSGGNYSTSGGSWAVRPGGGIHEQAGFQTVISCHNTAATTKDQTVTITVPEQNSGWAIFVRCPATMNASTTDAPGYCFRHGNATTYEWYQNGVFSAASTTGNPPGPATIEMRCVSNVCTVYINGTLFATKDFSATAIASNDTHQGFRGSGNCIINSAQGGDYPVTAVAPSQVTNFTAISRDATSTTLHWTAPFNGWANISGFRIERAPDATGIPGTFTNLVANTASFAQSYNDTGLTTGVRWWYRVSAINSVGTGIASISDDATARAAPSPAYTTNFSDWPNNWTLARWRSEAPGTPGDPMHTNSCSDHDGTLGGRFNVFPPDDVFYDSGTQLLYMGAGAQNYGDTQARCAVPFNFGDGGKIRTTCWLPQNFGGLVGYTQIYVSDLAYPALSETEPNTSGPVPTTGFCVRLNIGAQGGLPLPSIHTYNNGIEFSPVGTISFDPTVVNYGDNDIELTFNHYSFAVTHNGNRWFDGSWFLPASFTQGWVNIGAHNHATRKYSPFYDSYNATFRSFAFDSDPATALVVCKVADNYNPHTISRPEGPEDGMDLGWLRTGTVTIPNVPLGVSQARLLCTYKMDPGIGPWTLQYSINGNTTHSVAIADFTIPPRPEMGGSGSGLVNHVLPAPSELLAGNNSLFFNIVGAGTYGPLVGNFQLIVEGTASTGNMYIGANRVVNGGPIRKAYVGASQIWQGPPIPLVPTGPVMGTPVLGNAQVSLVWSPPASDGGSTLTGYLVEKSPNGTSTWTTVTTTAATARATTATGLTNGTIQYFRVSAINAIGTGAASNVVSATPTAALRAPGPPNLVSALGGNTTITLGWTAPADNGGAAISTYTVEYANVGVTGWTVASSSVTGLSYTHTGRTNDSLVAYQVTAVNSVGAGPPSNTLTGTATATGATPPTSPTLSAATPGNAQVVLTWTTPSSNGGASITGYDIETSANGTTGWTAVTTTGVVLTYTHTGRTNGTAYFYRVSARNAVGPSSPSNVLGTTAGIPTAPTLTSATGGDTTVVLNWTAPSSSGASAITGYLVETSANGTSGWSTVTTTGVVLTYTHTGRTNGTTYYYRVSAVNGTGTSAPSGVLGAIPAGAATAPNAPTGLGATAGIASVALAWTAPFNGGSVITDYTVQYRTTAGPGSWNTFSHSASTATAITVTGLTNGTGYDFQVAAVNAIGTSAYSSNVSATPTATGGPPFNIAPWTLVMWAEDPTMTPPSNGATIPSTWNQPGTYTTAATWARVGTPTFITSWVGGRPAISFPQGGRLTAAMAATNQNHVTVAFVAETTTSESDLCDSVTPQVGPDRLVLDRSGSHWRMYRGNNTDTGIGDASPHLFIARFFNDGADTLTIDGVTRLSSFSCGSLAGPNIALGSSTSNTDHVTSKIAFAGVITGELSTTQRSDLLAWFHSYYGV
jgi:Fibronectin type III domain